MEKNLQVKKMADAIEKMIGWIAGVESVDTLWSNEDGALVTRIELNGTSEAWIALSDINGSGAQTQLEHIEGVYGCSIWLVTIPGPATEIEKFTRSLADVMAVSAFAGGR